MNGLERMYDDADADDELCFDCEKKMKMRKKKRLLLLEISPFEVESLVFYELLWIQHQLDLRRFLDLYGYPYSSSILERLVVQSKSINHLMYSFIYPFVSISSTVNTLGTCMDIVRSVSQDFRLMVVTGLIPVGERFELLLTYLQRTAMYVISLYLET
jgi:hypothetical protein